MQLQQISIPTEANPESPRVWGMRGRFGVDSGQKSGSFKVPGGCRKSIRGNSVPTDSEQGKVRRFVGNVELSLCQPADPRVVSSDSPSISLSNKALQVSGQPGTSEALEGKEADK
ncbi:hypothetical protein PAAG_12093 [Paracoccidioides lutzii Pb01]|uniref:Uncharacterized protein n=1 Tax=Paracoccidioides lutzii (strain ATCC MYA-826 / Pb01) TaxID=502779 RepID=A0A0A2V538_PARBA|nr:hypothetical protein PAAG_12093 [Paracoccidioides lutzii Pb01]KGQ01235.1 hypothetical protein PAAG_12093 [Paracoccidioides lutzii Pb01]